MASVGALRPIGLRRRLPWALGVSPNRKKRFAVGGCRVERLSSGAGFRWRRLRQRRVQVVSGIGFAHAGDGGALWSPRKSKGQKTPHSPCRPARPCSFARPHEIGQGHNGAQVFFGCIEAGSLQGSSAFSGPSGQNKPGSNSSRLLWALRRLLASATVTPNPSFQRTGFAIR